LIYLSADGAVGASDILLGSRSVPALAGGETSSGSTSVTIPAGTAPKTWYLIAKADGEGVLAETSETNNTFSKTIYIGPDLIVSAISAPATAVAGQTISIGDTTKNNGADGAPETVTEFYISANSILDASDILIGSRGVPAPGRRPSRFLRGRPRAPGISSSRRTPEAPWRRHGRPITLSPSRSR
jgi:subtilase family serine protease